MFSTLFNSRIASVGLAGLIATNTTLDHSELTPAREQTGGLSGLPLRDKSTAFVRAIRARTQPPVIGVAGSSDRASHPDRPASCAPPPHVHPGHHPPRPAPPRAPAQQ